jgi:4-amino-4-deoxy-L-arabinose transferase-like glycosyltransferase
LIDRSQRLCQHGCVSSLRNRGGVFIALGLLALLYSQLPLGTALEFGRDEGYLLMRAFLWSQGHTLYQEIWSDQPPLLTVLLGCLFKVFGPSLLAARLLMVTFGSVLFLAQYELVRKQFGLLAGLLAFFFLAAAPFVLQLSVSAMLEVPAFALGLLALVALHQWKTRWRIRWLVVSGMLMALALQIKFSAAILVPAVLIEVALTHHQRVPLGWFETTVRDSVKWAASLFVTFGLLALLLGFGGYQSLWQPHVVVKTIPALSSPEHYTFPVSLLWRHVDGIIAAVLGLYFALKQRRLRDLAVPLVILASAVIVHLFHRPWWPYYYLHFAVPLAWLGGYGAAELLRPCLALLVSRGFRIGSSKAWRAVGLVTLVALGLALAEARLEGNVRTILRSPRAADNPLLARIAQFRDQTRWMYSEQVIYAFHARIQVPPELAVVTLKRFWSGQISMEGILELLKRYQPEQLLLHNRRFGPEWEAFLSEHYVAVAEEGQLVLYMAKELRESSQVK